jgi:hypothetical protein
VTLDESFNVVGHVPNVDVHAGLDALLVEPEDDDLMGVIVLAKMTWS